MQAEAASDSRSDTRQIIPEYAAPELKSINRDGFFGKNAASTVFSPRVEYKGKPEIQYFPASRKQEEEEELPPEQVVVGGQQAESATAKADLTSPEGIVAAFGNPAEDDKILAEEKAPPSYKGMMAALELGDRKLAWQYARRYARRVRELGSRSTYIMGLTGKAFEREGVLPKDGWQSSPQFAEQQKLLEEDLKESGQLETEKSRIARLDPETRAFLKQAQEAEEKAGAKSVDSPKGTEQAIGETNEAAARAQIRGVLAGKVPVDPKGLVDIYFFLRPRDSASLAAAPEVEKFFREASLKPGVHFVGLTMEEANPIEVDDYRKRTGVTFSIQSGGALADQFKLRTSPVTIFVTQTTSKVVIEEGARPAYYLDEVLRLMQGK